MCPWRIVLLCRQLGFRAPVPQTGQTQCWDSTGTRYHAPARAGWRHRSRRVSSGRRFTDQGNGTVQDNLTGVDLAGRMQLFWSAGSANAEQSPELEGRSGQHDNGLWPLGWQCTG